MARRVSFLSEHADRASGRLLPWVIAVMVFLSGIALASALGVHDAIANWSSDLGRRMTVQVVAAESTERDAQAAAVEALLSTTPGIQSVSRLDGPELMALLEPWIGGGDVGGDLPLPVLIDVTLTTEGAISTAALASQLRAVAPDASLDTNEQWLGRMRSVAGMVEGTALAVVALVTLATVAIVIFGTHAGLAAHRQTIETLHIIGARDGLIAGEFQHRFLILGLKGGFVGLAVAAVTLFAGRNLLQSLGGGILEQVSLQSVDMILMLVLPLAAGLIAMVTARLTVLRALSLMV